MWYERMVCVCLSVFPFFPWYESVDEPHKQAEECVTKPPPTIPCHRSQESADMASYCLFNATFLIIVAAVG